MKKNGFISTSLIYTFFLVFLILMIYLLNSYGRVRFLLDQYKYDIRNTFAEENNADINVAIMVWNNETKEYEREEKLPTRGYYFEGKYSYCKNGSIITYLDGNISIRAKSQDSCFAYFKESEEDVIIKIYTKETINSPRVEVNYIPNITYDLVSKSCNNDATIEFDKETRKFKVKANSKAECEVEFLRKEADVNIHIFREDVQGEHIFDDIKYKEVSRIPGSNYEYYSYKCMASDILTSIYPNDEGLRIESSGNNDCNVYYKGGTDKVEIIIMQETVVGISGYTTGKKYSRTYSIPSIGYKYVGYLCDSSNATVSFENGTFIASSTEQTTCRVYFEEYNNNVFFYYYLEKSDGNYEEVGYSPGLGYAFDSSKSYCEKGSTINVEGNIPIVNAEETDECHIYYYMTNKDVVINVYVMNRITGRYELSNVPTYGYSFYNAGCTNGANVTYKNGNLKVVNNGPTVCTVYFR